MILFHLQRELFKIHLQDKAQKIKLYFEPACFFRVSYVKEAK